MDATEQIEGPVRSPDTGEVGSLSGTSNVEPELYHARLREIGPIVWDPVMGAWLITSYKLVREVATYDELNWRSPMAISGERPMGLEREVWLEFVGSPWQLTLLEGEVHRRSHRWWMNAFSEKSLGAWKQKLVEPVAHAQIDRFIDHGRAELAQAYANRVSPRISAAILGLPWEDEAWIERLEHLNAVSLRVFEGQADDSQDESIVNQGMEAKREIFEMFGPFVRARKDGTGEDLISIFWRDAEQLMGTDFTEEDILANVALAFSGAANTTAHMTSNCIYLLLTQPELQEQVRTGGIGVKAAFVEEALRLYSTIAWRPRIAKRDVELGGVTIREGEQIVALTGGVQRDPDHYEHANDVDLDRAKPKDHFAFMRGPHQCPGRALARLELVSIVSVLLDRVEQLKLASDAPQPEYVDWVQRHWVPLHATFVARGEPARY
jgi:cytochrome P450